MAQKLEIANATSSLESIMNSLGIPYNLIGSKKILRNIKNFASLSEALKSDISFCSSTSKDAVNLISKSNAGIVICNKSLEENLNVRHDKLFVLVENPRLFFIHLANRTMTNTIHGVNKEIGISKTAVISDSAKIGRDVTIGNFVYVGDNCVIGDNTVLSDRISIRNSEIGNNCIIQSGVAIGEDGFAYERNVNFEPELFPHMRGVRIEDNVEIRVNSSIARGSLTDTVIGAGTKIDALVHVAHNVKIGKNCLLTAGVIIGGSTTLGDVCWLGLNSTLKNKIALGNQVIVGSGASVINNIPDNDVVAGIPARSIKHKVTSDQLFLMAGHTK